MPVGHLMIEPQNRGDGLRITDGAAQNHTNRRGEWDQTLVDHFVGLGLCFAGAKTSGQIDRHGFSDESGAGIKRKDAAPMEGGVSGFLEKFALGCGQRLFTGIDASGWEFPQKIICGMPILTLQQDTRRGARFVDSEHYDRAAVVNDVAAGADASGLLDVIGGHPEDGAVIHGAGRNYLGSGVGTLAGFSGL